MCSVEDFLASLRSGLAVRMQCMAVSDLLCTVFDGEPYYNHNPGHVITKIGDRFYDLDGEVDPEGYTPLKEWGDNWFINLREGKFSFNRWQIQDAIANKKYVY